MFGVTFIIFLYHLLQYFYLKESVFLWFSVWLFFCCATQAMSVGAIIGSLTVLRFEFWALIANGIFYTFWFFGRQFINSKQKYPLLDKVMKGLAFFLLAEIILVILYKNIFNIPTNQTGIGIHYTILNIYTIASFIVSIILVTKKDLFARYFGIGSFIGSSFLILGTLWSLGIVKPIRYFDPYATGILLQIIIYSFGISYRRQVLNKYHEKERLVAQRNIAEIKRIKDLDEIKSKFFANISHEFRTPLSLIKGPLNSVIRKNADNDDEVVLPRKSLDIINRNTNRLKYLIDQLLELSKIESGKIHLSLNQGGLIAFLKSIVFSFESMSERQNISLNTSFPQEIDSAFYDRDKLEKILTNVLSNAFKFTPNGGVITVAADYDNEYFTIQVSDTGKGMNSEDVKRVFERFYRAEGSEEKGSGIGLALAKEMVDILKGQINVSSRKNEGTTFKIRIPYTLKMLPKDISVINKESAIEISETTYNDILPAVEEEFLSNTNKKNTSTKSLILVIEDNIDLRQFIASILNTDYSVLTAADGLQGERMAYEHIPDIIITDVMMPKKDGYQLCNALKNNNKTSHIPVIMLTAKADQTNKIEGLMQGADAYLTKPFDADELLIRIKNLIDARRNVWEYFKASDLALIDSLDVTSLDDKFMQNVLSTIKQNLDNEDLSVSDLAKQVGFSRAQLHRKLKALIDKSANQLIVEIRMNEAKRMLENKVGSVSEIAYAVGYSNMSYFSKSFKQRFGTLPSKI